MCTYLVEVPNNAFGDDAVDVVVAAPKGPSVDEGVPKSPALLATVVAGLNAVVEVVCISVAFDPVPNNPVGVVLPNKLG